MCLVKALTIVHTLTVSITVFQKTSFETGFPMLAVLYTSTALLQLVLRVKKKPTSRG